jgi:formylglycine-generating enzyme required for sulfatase activity
MKKTPILLICIILLTTGIHGQKPPLRDMILVKGGTFKMGCTKRQYECTDSEKPAHWVTLDDFYISRYEITNDSYCRFLNEIGANPGGSYYGFEYIDIGDENCKIEYKNKQFFVTKGYEKHPVVEVTWYGAKAYCHWAEGRLPTEAEWEYAARGGKQQNDYFFSGNDTIEEVAWFKGNYFSTDDGQFKYRKGTIPVGKKQPNALGLYDMSGNVWELCNDWFSEEYYENSPKKNPKGPEFSHYRVKRGGSFKTHPKQCIVSKRNKILPGYSQEDVGFRLVKPVKKQ